jgi:hypothetical protein
MSGPGRGAPGPAAEVITSAADGRPCAACRTPATARYTTVVGPAQHIVFAAVLCAGCRAVIGAAFTASVAEVA